MTIGGLEAAVNYFEQTPHLIPVFRIPDAINNVLAALTGEKFMTWLLQKGAKITFSHCDIQSDKNVSVHLMITIQSSGAQRLFDHPVVLELLFTVFFPLILQLQLYLEEKTLTSLMFHN
jgi:hypothetical protein